MNKTSSLCKKCRREATKLFLKGDRCKSTKCAMVKRNYLPGVHGPKKMMSKASTYAKQLREKQKAKRIYGLLEKQFVNIVKKAMKNKKDSGKMVLHLLESRFDNIIYKLHLAESRSAAKQLISHRHFQINGKSVNIPSCTLKIGDKISVKDNKKSDKYWEKVKTNAPGLVKDLPNWLTLDPKTLEAQVTSIPDVSDMDKSISTALIIEFYSR